MNDVLVRGRPAVILLVEDNDDDVVITRIGFERARFAIQLHHVASGEECLAFLRKEGRHADAPTPDIVLLDLNMPRMSGVEVMAELNRDERLRHLVVVVMTSSTADEDVLRSYKLRCSSYIVKPLNFETFVKVIQSLGDYWFTLVTLPPAQRT
jgi:two-component system, chemotaxis family, response regulator Rcp1